MPVFRNPLNGPPGPAGRTVHTTSGAPSNGLGADGDFAYDPLSTLMYGPKSGGTWPTGVSLKGPKGDAGATGATGPAGPAGTGGGASIPRQLGSVASGGNSRTNRRSYVAGQVIYNTLTTMTLTTRRPYAIPHFNPTACTLTGIQTAWTTAPTEQPSVEFAVYATSSANEAYPGNKIYTSGVIATDTTASVFGVSPNLALAAGTLYWFTFISSFGGVVRSLPNTLCAPIMGHPVIANGATAGDFATNNSATVVFNPIQATMGEIPSPYPSDGSITPTAVPALLLTFAP